MKISIFHPFTAKAAGAVEKSLAQYHSQPHLKAMQMYSERYGAACSMEYLTHKLGKFNFTFGDVDYKFYPVDIALNGDHKKWKKQTSKSCAKQYQKATPDITIINMSGHSSKFSHSLAKIITENKKAYIAMLGGQHYSDSLENREYYKNANHLLVHTHLQKSAMEKMALFKNLDIRVFPLGVDCDVFKPSDSNNTKPNLLYVGRIIEWKRIHLAIEAVEYLVKNGFKDATLNIIGPVVSQNYFNALKAMILEKELSNNVNFLGHVNHADLPKHFQNANLFTLPSDKETFGMVMIEAMACGTPVAGIDCPGGPKDVITNGYDGLLSSPEDYSDVILEYFQNKDFRSQLEVNAIKKATSEFSIEATYKVLEKSIQSCITSLNG